MPDDKGGSDLDVFEGLGKKQQNPESVAAPGHAPDAPATIRGGFGTPSSSSGRVLPIPSKPSKKSQSSSSALPKPTPPPSKGASLSPASAASPASNKAVSLPRPKPPPSKGSASIPPPASSSDMGAAHVRRNSPSDAPEVMVGTDFGGVFADQEGPGSILPGGVAADLDWDDTEESTAVFDRADHDLFENLEARSGRFGADDTARRAVASAAALLKQSGGSAAPVVVPPAPAMPTGLGLPIPGPLPIPRDATPAHTPAPMLAEQRGPAYAPSLPPPARAGASKMPWLFALLAMVALAAAAVVYFRANRTGDVTISATRLGKPLDAAKVYIEGQPRCEFTPCVIEGLTPGKKSIRVTYGGQVAQQEVTIEAGGKHQISVAVDETTGTPVAPEPGKLCTLKVGADSGQKGVKVFVDGVDKGPLPLELKELPPGTIKLRFVGGDAFAATERTVELKAGETTDLGAVTLTMAKVKVTFQLDTAGAKVKLISEGDKREEEELKFARGKEVVKTLDTSKKWSIEGSKKGFDELKRELSFADGKAEQLFKIELSEQGKEPPPIATAPSTATGATTATSPPATASATATAPPSGGMATLSVNSVPPSKAIVDGRPVGSTPTTVQVPAGSHTVVFVHKDLGRKSVTVTVGAGETKVAAVRFKKKESSE
jgi:hypothetical protein